MSTADSASPDPLDWEQSSEHHLCGLWQEGQGTTSAEMGTRVSLLLCSHQCKHWNCQISSRIPFHKAGYLNLLKKKKKKKKREMLASRLILLSTQLNLRRGEKSWG